MVSDRDVVWDVRQLYISGHGASLTREELGEVVNYIVKLETQIDALQERLNTAFAHLDMRTELLVSIVGDDPDPLKNDPPTVAELDEAREQLWAWGVLKGVGSECRRTQFRTVR